jgi:tRNA-binding EMAP/Myf-like protein
MLLDTQTTRKGYDIIIDISDDFPENAGADIVYAKNKETVEIPASQNTLIVVKIDENTRSFLKYANHYAKDKRRNFLVQHI